MSAPTGSGKTLAAFLICLDRLVAVGLEGRLDDRIDVVYVSPLKALSNDIGRNLETPLAEIETMAVAQGLPHPGVRTAVRTGDTPAWERERMVRRPPHILVTTPESLFILLTAERGREALRQTSTVIVDEIHALVDDKRGSHLALTLVRLEDLVLTAGGARPQRIGLSATVRPIEDVASFLHGSGAAEPLSAFAKASAGSHHSSPTDGQAASGGGKPSVEVIDSGHRRQLDLAIEVPRDELGVVATNEMWGEIYDRLSELILAHRTTLVFVNTRRLCERVAHHLAERLGDEAVLAHHGSLSRRLRQTAESQLKAGRLRAVWRGHVEPRYFRGTGVRFFCDGKWIRGRIRSVATRTERGRRQVTSVNVQVARPVARGSIGMWDLPNPVIRGRRVYARGCDDVAGVAAVIAALDELHRGRGTVDVIGLFTRAEEIGFAGAITAGRSGLIPRRGRIVAVETSSEIPGVRMGDGPILRVGDRHAIFTPPLTAFCGQVARDLAKRDRAFKFQRKLMDAGTCESAALCALGFEATGLCLALGNYHNMDAKRRRIGPEYIHLGDFEMLVQWFVGLARSKREADDGDADFRTWIDRLERKWSERLVRTARRSPCK